MNSKTSAELKETGKEKSRPRKKRFRILPALLVLILLIGASVFFYTSYTKTHYRISFYRETSQKIVSGIRIAVISDIHNREYGEHNETLLSDLRALKPDLILFLGDLVIREQAEYQPVVNLISASAEMRFTTG